jgi:hypothetical protein
LIGEPVELLAQPGLKARVFADPHPDRAAGQERSRKRDLAAARPS